MPSPAALRLLIVEDEPAIADTLGYALRSEGWDVTWCATGEEALAVVRATPPALVVLDIGLPDFNGFEVCRRLRTFSAVPVLFLTARQGEIDRVLGLELGGDDYVVKPFSPREVAARVRAILRRTQAERMPPLPEGAAAGESVESNGAGGAGGGNGLSGGNGAAGPEVLPPLRWTIDAERCQISYAGQALELTRNEYRLVRALCARPGKVFTREELLALAWEEPAASLDRTVDAHVKSVRAKVRALAPEVDPIVTHRGLGYSWREEG